MTRTHASSLQSRVAVAGLVALSLVLGPVEADASGGALDPTFASSGLFTSGSGTGGSTGLGQPAALDASGRLVIVGYAADSNGVDDDFVVMRLTRNGSPDATFGTSGVVKTHFTGTGAFAQAVAIDSHGRVVVGGYVAAGLNNAGHFALARYESDGSLDATFGAGGTLVTVLGSNEEITGVGIDSTDRIVVEGFAYNGTTYDFALARYTSAGALDTSFNQTGTVLTDFGENEEGSALAIDPSSGQIAVAGVAYSSFANAFAVARYNPDGSLDTTFGGTGKVLTTFTGQRDWAFGVAIDGAGKIVAVGVTASFTTNNDFAVARYNADGSLDTTFNGTGKVTTNFGGNETAHSVAIDPTGRLVVAGAYTPNDGSGNTLLALARYRPDGTLDGAFGTGGMVTTASTIATHHDRATGVFIDGLQRIVVAGYDQQQFALLGARYLSASADLAITASASPDPVAAGQPLTYTVTVTNNGPDATPVELDDALPAGLIYSSATASVGNCAISGTMVTCSIPSLDAAAVATITITVGTTAAAVPSVTNAPTVSGNDPNPADDTASVTTTVNPAADLSLAESAAPDPVSGGGQVTYTIVVTNNGPSPATGVTLTDQLTDRFVSSSTTSGSCAVAKSKGTATLTCNLGSLDSGATATVSVTLTAPHKKGTTSNTATVTANETDPDTSNNAVTATVTIQ